MRDINFTWQTGIEKLAYGAQYLLYKADVRWCKEKRKKKRLNENEKNQEYNFILICILCCLIAKRQPMQMVHC